MKAFGKNAALLMLVFSSIIEALPADDLVPRTDELRQAARYARFTVISPKAGVRYTSIPGLSVLLPARDDVIYTLFRCPIPDDGRTCEHAEGEIAASDLQCSDADTNCRADVSFDIEMPLEKAYRLYIRPRRTGGLVEVRFELSMLTEQLGQEMSASKPAVAMGAITAERIPDGMVVEKIEQPEGPLLAGQVVDLKVWLKNMGAVRSKAGLKYSVVCEVKGGGGACPFEDAVQTIDAQIDPGARHAEKLTGSVAQAGVYAVTVAAPVPEKGEPFTGNSVTRTLEVVQIQRQIKRQAIKSETMRNDQP